MSFLLFLLSHRHIWNNVLFSFFSYTATLSCVFMLKAIFRICFKISSFTQLFPKMFTFPSPLEVVSFDVNLSSPTVNFLKRGLSILKAPSSAPKPLHTKGLHKRADGSPRRRFCGSTECQEPTGCHPRLGIISVGSGLRRRCSCPALQRRA